MANNTQQQIQDANTTLMKFIMLYVAMFNASIMNVWLSDREKMHCTTWLLLLMMTIRTKN